MKALTLATWVRAFFIFKEVVKIIEVSYLREYEKVKVLPKEVQETIQGILQILDTEYGAERNKYEDDGGYVLVVEEDKDFEEIKNKTYIDCTDVIATSVVTGGTKELPLVIPMESEQTMQKSMYYQELMK